MRRSRIMRINCFFLAVYFGLTMSLMLGLLGSVRAESIESPKEVNIAVIFHTYMEEPWNMSLYQALERVKKEKPHGLDVNFDVTENVSYPDGDRVLKSYAKTGKYDIIMAHSAFSKAVDMLRKEFPEILWSVSGAGNDLMGGNGYVINYTLHEPAYLMGMIAGMMTKSNTIGAVAAFPYPNENTPVNAYHEGAKSVNRDIKFVISYIESWFDPPKAKEFALAQINSGADFEYAVSFGLLEACKEKGAYAFGHCIDQNYLAPNVVVSSAMAYWDPAVKLLIDDWWNHMTEGTPYNAPMEMVVFYMKEGGADIAPYHGLAAKIPEEVKKAVEKKRQEIKKGTFTVPFLPQKAESTK